MRRYSLILALSTLSFLLFYSCGGQNSIYSTEYPLSLETAKSGRSNFTVAVPQGWYIAENEQFDLWLVCDDLSGTIIFQSFNLDQETKKSLLKDPTSQLIVYSKMFRRGKLGEKYTDLKKDEEFRLNNTTFGAYEYIDGKGNIKRVVVFPYAGQYYESITVVKPPIQEANLDKIFSLQNSVLKSLK